ncbi:MAG: sulfotransferase, partial [Granulosicoccaceae bacterium]
YLLLGLIHMMFPDAKIIHAIRNPLDTCLSCYLQNFAQDQVPWSFDLDNIANRYLFYRDVMDYWKKMLPEKAMLDVEYENVIDDQEGETRRIIDFIGLPWDAACLEFNNTKDAVRTASMMQVRQPIYKTSKMRARHYAKHLTGLANKLQKYLPDDPEFRKEFGIKKRWLGLFR